jgi:integrase
VPDIRKRKNKDGSLTYQVRYRNPAAKSGYAYKAFPTRKQAHAFHNETLQRVSMHSSPSGIRTISDAVALWLNTCKREGLNGGEPVTAYTLSNYAYRADFILLHDWGKELWQLTAPDIAAFRSWLLRTAPSRVTAQKVMVTLQSILKEMAVRGVIPTNIAAGITIRTDTRYDEPVVVPGKGEVLALLAAADRLANSPNGTTARAWQRYRPMLYLAADTGMRPQEYLGLPRHCVVDGGFRVEQAIAGDGRNISVTKTKAGRRMIDASPNTIDMVQHYVRRHAPESEYGLVFPTTDGKWQSRKNWQRRGFDAACLEAGLVRHVKINGEDAVRPKFRPYDLRHFFASMLIAKKLDLKKIQTMMGHESIKTTLDTYGHLLEDADDDRPRFGLLDDLGAHSTVSSCGAEQTTP